jgi:hypothetical protein
MIRVWIIRRQSKTADSALRKCAAIDSTVDATNVDDAPFLGGLSNLKP